MLCHARLFTISIASKNGQGVALTSNTTGVFTENCGLVYESFPIQPRFHCEPTFPLKQLLRVFFSDVIPALYFTQFSLGWFEWFLQVMSNPLSAQSPSRRALYYDRNGSSCYLRCKWIPLLIYYYIFRFVGTQHGLCFSWFNTACRGVSLCLAIVTCRDYLKIKHCRALSCSVISVCVYIYILYL